jgi:thiamine-phosphate pyrophosphorylase
MSDLKVDYALYLVTDEELAKGRPIEEIVAEAIQGGVTVVQYREKTDSTREMVARALALRELCRSHKIPFIVNDRIDIALACGADGVHVGQDDMPAAMARQLIGPGKILGVSVGNIAETTRAIRDGADYLGASPIFDTPTKPDAPRAMGIAGLQEISKVSSVPVVAIGGLNEKNAALMMRAGAAGVAVVSAIIGAEDPKMAAQRLKQVIDEAKVSAPGRKRD